MNRKQHQIAKPQVAPTAKAHAKPLCGDRTPTALDLMRILTPDRAEQGARRARRSNPDFLGLNK